MGIEDYHNSARYRQKLAVDLRLLFPHLTEPDEQTFSMLTGEMLQNAYEERRREVNERFGSNLKELEPRMARLTSGFEHLTGFLDARQAFIRRQGRDPLRRDPAAAEATGFKSVFLGASRRSKLVAVGGGKGGIGKSLVAANLAIGLAAQGRQVVAIDMDLGGADLHLSLGLRTLPRSLNDFIENKFETLDEVRLGTAYKNLSLIATDSSRLGAANIKFAHKEKILRHLGRLDCDIVLVDLGAEVSFNVLDVFLAADHRYVVTSTEPTSVLEAYGLIKLSLYRKLRHFAGEMVPTGSDLGQVIDGFLFEKDTQNGNPKTVWQLLDYVGKHDPELHQKLLKILYNYRVDLVINMSEREADMSIAKTIARLCQDNLAINLQRGYRIPWDRRVRDSARKLIPVAIDAPASDAAKALLHIAGEAFALHGAEAELSQRIFEIATGAKERTLKMREMAVLNDPNQPVNRLIPLETEEPTTTARLRDFLNREIKFRR
jgi:flagellar biosynthesis protein FlhG